MRVELRFLNNYSCLSVVIGNFGHCTQELMNLLLVGQATSNVFDGSMPLGGNGGGGDSTNDGGNKDDSLMLRGIPSRSTVGYLTQLEALRYCQVGCSNVRLLNIGLCALLCHHNIT